MKSRIITLLVALLCLPLVGWGQEVWDGTADTEWYDKNPEASEFTITTAEELAGLAELAGPLSSDVTFSGKTVKLGANIILNEGVLNADKELNEGDFHEWTPIDGFSGTFDGQGHTISGLYIMEDDLEDDASSYLGLFARAVGKIEDTGIVDSYIKGGLKDYVSAFFAYGDGGSTNIISRCYFDGLIEAVDPYCVGLVCMWSGSVFNMIESCYNLGKINVTMTSKRGANASEATTYINGIGGSGATHQVYNCYNAGDINVTINYTEAKPNTFSLISISGIGTGLNVSCYNTGNITVSGSKDNATNIAVGGISGLGGSGIHYCYNTGKISSSVGTTSGMLNGAGNIMGFTLTGAKLEKNYYLKESNESGIGLSMGGSTEDVTDQIEGVSDFSTGEIAWKMREPITVNLIGTTGKPNGETVEVTGYGQQLTADGDAIDKTPVLLAFDENKGKEVYQLTLSAAESSNITIDDTPIYRIAIPSNLLPEETYNSIKEDAGEGRDVVWKDEDGNIVVSGNKYTPTKDIALTATIDNVYDINTEVAPEDAGTISVKESAAEEETVSFTVTPNEGYELSSTYYIEEGKEEQVSITNNTFVMPASNITIYAIFTEIETEEPEQPGGDEDDDEDQGNTGIHKPQRPIKYYNIYVDTICPGLNVEVSKDVVQEGHQVSAYLTIQAECDTTGMRFEYKRGLFGYWQDLKALEGVQPGEYIIKNIYTDIYIRALDATLPEEEPTGIEDVESAKAYTKDGSIYIYTPNREEVTIISMSGAIIKHAEQIGLQSYNVSRGIYIVRIGEKVFKLKN